MKQLTLFTWGYWGWGTATDRLIQAVDAVEASRGCQPPLFVDIRISRSVRAPGFNGRAFEKAVGPSRYRWLDALGNLAVTQGGRMRIKDPAAANTLLDIAVDSARSNQRVLFFCSCEFPGVESHGGCHRVTVARLVLEAAQRRKIPLQVVEWPGGEPDVRGLEIQLSAAALDKIERGSSSIPLHPPISLAEMAGTPWYSLVSIRCAGDKTPVPVRLVTGPARYKKEGWYLPIYGAVDSTRLRDKGRGRVHKWREMGGFAARQVKR